MKYRYRFIFLVFGASLLPLVNADSLRCGQTLIGPGDRMFEVRRACGEPDIKVLLNAAFSDAHGLIVYDEEWQYNLGPQQLMRFVRFRNSKVSHIEAGPHGFNDPAGACEPGELSEGLSVLELLGRCGEPEVVERRLAERVYRLSPAGPDYPAGTLVEDWVYNVGRNYFYRIVTVIDGKVIRIQKSNHRN